MQRSPGAADRRGLLICARLTCARLTCARLTYARPTCDVLIRGLWICLAKEPARRLLR